MRELELIFESDMRSYPPRLPDQPIFYPVLNEPYATQIARKWNTKATPFAGYVTRFELDDDYARTSEVHVVGGTEHQEFWIPAEDLPEFNSHIKGQIAVTAGYFGAGFDGHIPEKFTKFAYANLAPRLSLGVGHETVEAELHMNCINHYFSLDIFQRFQRWRPERCRRLTDIGTAGLMEGYYANIDDGTVPRSRTAHQSGGASCT